jgi:hypothetical protein
MRKPSLTLLAALVFAAAAVPARAQDPGFTLVDRGRLIAYHGDTPIATERFLYERSGDSLVIIAHANRREQAADGSIKPYSKSMTLVARADDFGLLDYHSTEDFDGHVISRHVMPNDTMLTISTEVDKRGAASTLERPPGRFFAVDPGIFTLFDVIVRNLHGRLYGSRPVPLVVLGEDSQAVDAVATPSDPDTLDWGGRRVPTDRVLLSDDTGLYVLWVSGDGHLLKMQNEKLRMIVEREAPENEAPAPPPARRRGAKR